jgi:lipopolysaccharide export LptBFGC system permease protein LptF
VALPVGFLVGSLIGLRARGPKGRTLRRLLIGAGTVVPLTTIDWIVPLANQRYRELLTSDLMARGVARTAIHLDKGPGERSLRELYDPRAQLRQGETKELHALRFSFHSRLALILSPVAFAILAFGVVSVGRERWSAVAAAIGLVVAVIAVVWFDGPADGWPPLLRAYTPDLIFGTLGAVLLWCSVKWPDGRQPITNDSNLGNAALK